MIFNHLCAQLFHGSIFCFFLSQFSQRDFQHTAIGSVYHFAPDIKREFVWITPGSVAATALWLVISLGFKWYVFHFGNYQKTYGAIGGVMVALLWFYFSGLAILLGAQLNATIDRALQLVEPAALKVA